MLSRWMVTHPSSGSSSDGDSGDARTSPRRGRESWPALTGTPPAAGASMGWSAICPPSRRHITAKQAKPWSTRTLAESGNDPVVSVVAIYCQLPFCFTTQRRQHCSNQPERESWLHGEYCWMRALLQGAERDYSGLESARDSSLLLREMILLGRTRCWRLLLAALIMSTVCVGQSKFSIATGGKNSTTLPFELIDNRVFVEVRLNGRGSFHFILDTGASGFSLIDTTVQRLGLRTESAGEDGGVGEKTVRVSRCHLAQLQLGDLQFEDLEAEVFPGSDSGNVFGTKPVV